MTAVQPLKVGVAGLGVMGRNHARVLSEIKDAALVCAFDPDAPFPVPATVVIVRVEASTLRTRCPAISAT